MIYVFLALVSIALAILGPGLVMRLLPAGRAVRRGAPWGSRGDGADRPEGEEAAEEVAPPAVDDRHRGLRRAIRFGFAAVALLLVAQTSYVHVGADEVGLVTKVYGGSSLKEGRIIATAGEQGKQAEVIPPGFHVSVLLNVLNKIDTQPVTIVPDGKVGYLVARDGAPLRPDQAFADPLDGFKDADGRPLSQNAMLDAEAFLRNGGQKGPQITVLTPGTYRLNTFLWDVKLDMEATEIASGNVGVVKSNVRSSVSIGTLVRGAPDDCAAKRETGVVEAGKLAVPLVSVGCIGVWDTSILPGRYFINTKAFQIEEVPTRAQTWEYRGGYVKRSIDLEVSQDGGITPKGRTEEVKQPPEAADRAVFVKVEGWDVPQELRVLVQVTPELAPFVVASVGGVKQVEDNIITPLVRSVVRNVAGGVISAPVVCTEEDVKDKDGNFLRKASCEKGEPIKNAAGEVIYKDRPTRVLDLIENRPLLERNIEQILKLEGLKAGVDIKEVRLGDPAIPPELLVSRLREQLAEQLSKAYREEQKAQVQRVATENARATASQQSTLVSATINVQAAEQRKLAAKLEGEGEQLRLSAIAAGQKEQAGVLGEDRVVELRKYELLLTQIAAVVDKHPQVLASALANAGKFVPNTVVTGGTDGMISGLLGQFLSQQASPARTDQHR